MNFPHSPPDAPGGDSGAVPGAGARYRALVQDAVANAKQALRIKNVDGEEAVLFEGATQTLYLRYQQALAGEILARVEQLGETPGPRTEIVVVGGPRAFSQALASVSKKARRGVLVLHWTDDDEFWSSGGTRRSLAWRRVQRVRTLGLVVVDAERFQEQLSQGLQRYALERSELQRFAERFYGLRPKATYAVIAATALVFGLQLLWGGAESLPVLWRMGSMSSEQVREGEYWRLLSYAWLHSGWPHLLINMWVLSVLGGLIERLVGPARFLLLYIAGALGGGIAVLLMGEAQTVGASGAIWALLTATFVLSLRNDGLLPDPIRQSLKRSALVNLVINLGISFLPQVSMAGHLGGGILGAVVVASGAIAQPRYPGRASNRRRDHVLTQTSLFAVLLFAASALLAWRQGRPWTLNEPPHSVRVHLPDAPLSIELPEALTQHPWTLPAGEINAHLYGRLGWDPALVDVRTWRQPGLSPEAQAQELARSVQEPPSLPQGARVLEPAKLVTIDSTPVVRLAYQQAHVFAQLALFYVGDHFVQLEAAYAPGFEEHYAGLLDSIVRSARRENAARSGSGLR